MSASNTKPPTPATSNIIEANLNEASTSSHNTNQNHPTTSALNQALNNQILNSSSIEIDNQFILRMPVIKQENGTYKLHKSTQILRELLDKQQQEDKYDDDSSANDPLKDRLFIELNTETRKGRVKFDDEIFEARLVDLPCIIESLKTTDKKTFFKTGDICQMLVCRTQDDPWNSSEEEEKNQAKFNKLKKQVINQYYDPTNPALSHLRKYQWPHGITPPLKNVRHKRFRKIARKKTVDYVDIEKEVKQLFRADRDAIKIDYEVQYVDAESAEFLDDDNDVVNEDLILKSNDEYSSQDETNSIMQRRKLTKDKSNVKQQKSDNGNGTAGLSTSSNNNTYKSKEIIEDSNLSFDDTSKLNKYDENTTNTNQHSNNYDEEDESNMSALNEKGTNNNRTNFKNLFVKQVIGDLSSSSDEEDEENDNKKNNKHNNNDESGSNLEALSKSKYSFNDTNEFDDDEEDDDEAGGEDSDTNNINNNTSNKNITKKKEEKDIEDLSLSSTSNSMSDDQDEEGDDDSLKEKLNTLMNELQQIKEQRKRREEETSQITNPALKQHFLTKLNALVEEENKKMEEINQLKSILNE